MIAGLSPSEYSLLSQIVLDPLRQAGCTIWVFGSRARGTQHPFSDIDLLYELPVGKTLPDGYVSKIKENIENSRLNYKVDLVNVSNLADSYRTSVFNDRKLL